MLFPHSKNHQFFYFLQLLLFLLFIKDYKQKGGFLYQFLI